MIRRSAPTTSTRRFVAATLVLALAMLVAAGCGGDDGDGSDGGSLGDGNPPSTGLVKITTPSKPTPNASLTEGLDPKTTTLLDDAGCEYGVFDEQQGKHVESAKLAWKTFPPTSGTHIEIWAPFGLYDKPVPDGYVVHNLEHGGVAVWLGTKVDDATKDAVAGLLDNEEKWIVAPRKDIEGLYSAAWATGLYCSPESLTKLSPADIAAALDDWYDVVNSTGSAAEKDVPAYAGSMKEPTPTNDISADPPF